MRTLLIVDDEVLMAEGLRVVLSEAFAGRLNVLCCYSAQRALEIAVNTPIDILLTDINMPNCSGLELHKRLLDTQSHCVAIFLTGYSEFEYARQALDQRAFAYILKGEGDDVVIQTLERALDEMQEEPQETDEPEPAQQWLNELHSYIQSHLDGDISLNRLAEHCHFHPVYLSRAYKEATGTNLSDTINRLRLEMAQQLLLSANYSVLEISRLTGFTTDNYFCRWFRKHTGLSPHAYRKQNLKR